MILTGYEQHSVPLDLERSVLRLILYKGFKIEVNSEKQLHLSKYAVYLSVLLAVAMEFKGAQTVFKVSEH